MGTTGQTRYCHCGTRMARDNRGSMCNACAKAARNHLVQPPAVPREFWHAAEMQEALTSCDMGAVMRAFRTHPHHGRDISQEVAAGWVGITQTRLSRIENGEEITSIRKLMRWAHVLRVPADLLWFRMPSTPSTPSAAQATAQQDADSDAGRRNESPQRQSDALLLPVIVEGRPVLVPVDADRAKASGLGALLDEWGVMTPAPGRSAASAAEWETMSPLTRRSLLGRGHRGCRRADAWLRAPGV